MVSDCAAAATGQKCDSDEGVWVELAFLGHRSQPRPSLLGMWRVPVVKARKGQESRMKTFVAQTAVIQNVKQHAHDAVEDGWLLVLED